MQRASPVALSDAAEQRLRAQFAPEEQAEARRLLEHECGNNIDDFGPAPADHDRLRFAAMKASRSRIEGLHWALAMAKADWRDLLVEAGFADDPRAHLRWMVPGSAEEQQALQRWEPRDPLAGSALRGVAGMVIAPLQRHATLLSFTVQGVTASEFVRSLLSSLGSGEEVMLPDPKDDCGRYVRGVPGGWQTRLVCHGRFGDVWHDANLEQALAWLLPAAQPMVGDTRITGAISLPD